MPITLVFAGCLLIALAVFWPGLSGEFIFDDRLVLEPMGKSGITDLESLFSFILSFDSPLGRPLSMLSFALNDQYWPAVAWEFKYTNLLIHLLNGILVSVLTRQLASLASQNETRTQWVALATMAVWLFHPMQLSTMMTVAQRMTQLATLFTLGGLICYVHGRRVIGQQLGKGYFWLSLGVGLFGLLAVFSKENGILICVYALVIEATLVTATGIPKPRFWKAWSGIFLIAPLVLLVAGVVIAINFLQYGYGTRDFTPMERLLTEARVLFDYLGVILLPRQGGSGLFHDDYVVSTGLLHPPTTLLCLALIVMAVIVALWKRRTHAVMAFAVLWFLGGHLVESTVVGLELYFEHRNYLPMLGPLFAASYYLLSPTGRLRRVTVAALFAFMTLQLTMSYQSARIWGNEFALVQVWALENPNSRRAQQVVANYWAKKGKIEKTEHYLRIGAGYHPEDLGMQLQLLLIECRRGTITREAIDRSALRSLHGKYHRTALAALGLVRKEVLAEKCTALSPDDVERLITSLLANPNYNQDTKISFYLHLERGRIAIFKREINPAMRAFDEAYRLNPSVNIPLKQAIILASAGLYQDALEYVQIARNTPGRLRDILLPENKNIGLLERSILQAQSAQSKDRVTYSNASAADE